MNQKRFTKTITDNSQSFLLNIPCQGQEELILKIGGCSGRDFDKIQQLELDILDFGDSFFGIRGMVAYIECKILETQGRYGHDILFCEMKKAHVKKGYWSGKQFIASDGLPPILSFLGTKEFATISKME
jgi:flavin reductase (DIM6/NTAB) family NADH-FMN oxidoreductase RutF